MFGQEGREAALDSRNAAREYASRNQSGNQWFGHDPSAPPPQPGTKQHARGVGQYSKNKGESEAWYNYDASNNKSPEPRKPQPKPAATTPPGGEIQHDGGASHEESKQRAQAGKQLSQSWYTHEGYGDLQTPLEKKRAADKEEKRKKLTACDAAGKTTSPTKTAARNGQGLPPDWYTHEGHGEGDVSPTHHQKRSNPGLGNYAAKAKEGSAKDWFTHSDETGGCSDAGGGQSPRVKPEGQQYADRNKGSVQDWLFNYENMSLNEGAADTPRSSKKISAKKYEDSVTAVMHME